MRAIRWIGIALGSLLTLIVVALGVVYVLSERRIDHRYEVAGHEVLVPEDSAAVSRGEHVAYVRGCLGCHGEGLAGGTFIDVPVVARLHTANLTRGEGGVAAAYTSPKDWERAIRQGAAPDGRA